MAKKSDYSKQYARVIAITHQLKKLKAKLRRERAILLCLAGKESYTRKLLQEEPCFQMEGL